jgi:hypothetical protein
MRLKLLASAMARTGPWYILAMQDVSTARVREHRALWWAKQRGPWPAANAKLEWDYSRTAWLLAALWIVEP